LKFLKATAHVRHRSFKTHVLSPAQAIQSPRLINPTNIYIKDKPLNLMGAVLACIGLASQHIKKSRDKKKASRANDESQTQQLPPQVASQGDAGSQSVKEAQQGLQDEHLATVSPIVEPGGESRIEAEAAGTKEAQREIATAAPLPVPT
jgi:hypothetical protein